MQMSELQAKSNNNLALCPFCGGEAVLVEGEYGMYLTGYAIYCKGTCGAKLGVTGRLCEAYEWTPYFDTEAEAIAAWNSRAERTCFADEVTHRDCKYSVNRGWRERTCECIAEYAKSPLDGKTIVLHRCSSCNELMRPHMNYCPNCGARVVE